MFKLSDKIELEYRRRFALLPISTRDVGAIWLRHYWQPYYSADGGHYPFLPLLIHPYFGPLVNYFHLFRGIKYPSELESW